MVKQESLEEGQIVLGTVTKIIGTTIFIKIEDNGEGTMTTPEVAPGRIRNLRDYVVPGKKIVCKVLDTRNDNIRLSLRRVKQSEKRELLEKIAKEKSYKAILKTVLGEKDSEIAIEKITEDYNLLDFFEEIKQKKELLKKYVSEEKAIQINSILDSKKDKLKEVKKNFNLSSKAQDGILIVKSIIEKNCNQDLYKECKCNATYIAAGKYRLTLDGEDFRKLNFSINKILVSIEKEAKKQNCEFSLEKN
jgi:translation initiation factor 2 subunit 1